MLRTIEVRFAVVLDKLDVIKLVTSKYSTLSPVRSTGYVLVRLFADDDTLFPLANPNNFRHVLEPEIVKLVE
jgi:hypothetical protein